ncbi:MAG: mechanosensitive ion channel [Chloroflexi bacterium]|nr:mechanosensitive ion channel [Chloroflexota bacterium]
MDVLLLSLQDLLVEFLSLLPNLIVALFIFVIGLYLAGVVSRLVRKTMERRKADLEITILVAQITRWSVLIIGIMLALEQVGFNLTAFLAGLGILGFTVGFALQDVSKNFVAGMLLLLEQPFDIGDVIEVGDYTGTVARVDIRATEIYTFDGQNVLIPNGDVFTSPIKNYSRYSKRRLDFTIGVAYGSDLELARRTALEVVTSISGVLDEPAPTLVFNNLGESSIDFTIYFWVDLNTADYSETVDSTITGINAAFEKQNIEIPFPIRTVQLVQ